jgi:hypothetical protein
LGNDRIYFLFLKNKKEIALASLKSHQKKGPTMKSHKRGKEGFTTLYYTTTLYITYTYTVNQFFDNQKIEHHL